MEHIWRDKDEPTLVESNVAETIDMLFIED
jgi:hypothetical protein